MIFEISGKLNLRVDMVTTATFSAKIRRVLRFSLADTRVRNFFAPHGTHANW